MMRVMGNGVEINVARWKGKGRPVLALHGITANCRCWDFFAETLSPEFDFYAMDLRGRGRSEKPKSGYSPDIHAKDIVGVLDGLKIDRVVLVGHSLGAFLTLVFAARHTDRVDRIVLVDGAGHLSAEQLQKVFQSIKPALDRLTETFPSRQAYLERMRSAPYLQPWNAVIENYFRYEMEQCPAGVKTNIAAECIGEEAANVRKIDCRRLYPLATCPSLILRATNGLFGDGDLLLPTNVVAEMKSELPDATRYDVEGVNHYGIVMQPHKGRDEALLKFLRLTPLPTASAANSCRTPGRSSGSNPRGIGSIPDGN